VDTPQAEPSLWSPGFKAQASILLGYTTVNAGRKYGARARVSENVNVIRRFAQHVLAADCKLDIFPVLSNADWSACAANV
jgi:hypothetical protein